MFVRTERRRQLPGPEAVVVGKHKCASGVDVDWGSSA